MLRTSGNPLTELRITLMTSTKALKIILNQEALVIRMRIGKYLGPVEKGEKAYGCNLKTIFSELLQHYCL